MKKFIVVDDFWELFPEAKIGVITCMELDNTIRDQGQYQEMLCSAEREAMKHIPDGEFSSNPVIRVWRDAFQSFKTKKGARSSIESLLKRVHSGKPIGTINPLVDLYNSVSLKYGLPCGGEDMDCFAGNLLLTKADGNEEFVALGTDENTSPYPGEIIYKDDEGAVCRCWNWREAKRTMLTEDTRNAFICIEQVDENRMEVLEKAVSELAELVEKHLAGRCTASILNVHNREIIISE